jgi:hypothetical protein
MAYDDTVGVVRDASDAGLQAACRIRPRHLLPDG